MSILYTYFIITISIIFGGTDGGHHPTEVNGEVIMHHIIDDRIFEIFNPLSITHPIKIALYADSDADGKVKIHSDEILIYSGTSPLFWINKQVVMMFIVSFLLILFFTLGYKKNKQVQTGFGNLLEVIIVFIRDEVVYPNLGDKQGRKFLPLILTFFFFIVLMNLIGLVPGSATATANISITTALALITFSTYILFGNKDFWKHIFATPGVPFWLLPIMIPVELLGLLTKPFALAVRLFANMNAGHIIILAFLGIIINQQSYWIALGSVPMALAIYMLEVFVAFLQGYIFSLLSSIFISLAVTEHEHH